MIGAAGELVLPRRSLKQPSPHIHPGGDCGGCALGGALGIDVTKVYETFDTEGITNRGEMARCLRCAATRGLADRLIESWPEWPGARYLHSFGCPAYMESLYWFNYLRLATDAGYYGLCMVDFAGTGGAAGPDTNHWVLVCGTRTEGVDSRGVLTGDVLVSCSVKGEQWHEAREFLKNYGGYDVLLVRPMKEAA